MRNLGSTKQAYGRIPALVIALLLVAASASHTHSQNGSWTAYGPVCNLVNPLFCPGWPLSSPVTPQLAVIGNLNSSTVTIIRAPTDYWFKWPTFYWWVVGTQPVSIPTSIGCTLLVGGNVAIVGTYAHPIPDALCYFDVTIPPLGPSITTPVTFYVQLFYDRAAPGLSDAATHGISITIVP